HLELFIHLLTMQGSTSAKDTEEYLKYCPPEFLRQSKLIFQNSQLSPSPDFDRMHVLSNLFPYHSHQREMPVLRVQRSHPFKKLQKWADVGNAFYMTQGRKAKKYVVT